MKFNVNWRRLPQKFVWLIKQEVKIFFTKKCGILYFIRQCISIILDKKNINYLGSKFYYEDRLGPIFIFNYVREIKQIIKLFKLNHSQNTFKILEIGGNIGAWGYTFCKLVPNCEIFTFEPNPLPFKILKLNSKDFSNWKIFNYGVGVENKKVGFYFMQDKSAQGSIFKENASKNLLSETELKVIDIEVIKIDLNFSRNNLKGSHFDFIKIDVEGAEWNVIQGISNLSFENMYVELTLTESQNEDKLEQISKFYLICKKFWPSIILIKKILHNNIVDLYFKLEK